MSSDRHLALALIASVVATSACAYSDPNPSADGQADGGVSGDMGTTAGGGVTTGPGPTGGGLSTGDGGPGDATMGPADGTGNDGGTNATGSAPTASGSGTGGEDTGEPTMNVEGPCDILGAAGNECVAAYSTIRRLMSTYTGPLYQLRVGSSEFNIGGQRVTNPDEAIMPTNGTGNVPYQTTPEQGTLVDVPQTADGFADSTVFTTNCPIGTTCTVATIYDQSGKGNDLTVAKAGLNNGGNFAALDDFETVMNARAALTVGGHDVHSLYMESRQGYRQTAAGNDVPTETEAEGMYLLADGTHAGNACCWDFGNVTPTPATYAEMNTLFFGEGFWGNGNGQPPWFGADFEAGVWMGGSVPTDPGWGGLNNANPTGNPNNPSMNGVRFALGFLKTNSNAPDYTYAISTADVSQDDTVNKAYEGPYPKEAPEHRGAIVIGVGGDNSNNSFGTFYEGAVYAGYPDDATEQAVMENIKAVGYGR